jgi:hypothetical protein
VIRAGGWMNSQVPRPCMLLTGGLGGGRDGVVGG